MDNLDKSALYWASAFQQRDTVAFEHVFDMHYRSLCYYAQSMLADQLDAEDAVAEVFLKLWEKASDFDDLNSIKGFLYISTKNKCLDELKKGKRQHVSFDSYRKTAETSEEMTDFDRLEVEVLERLYEEIERLPTKARQIFKLLFFDGLKTDEVAARLGISVKTVRNQKARAIQLLQTVLLKKGSPVFLVTAILAMA